MADHPVDSRDYVWCGMGSGCADIQRQGHLEHPKATRSGHAPLHASLIIPNEYQVPLSKSDIYSLNKIDLISFINKLIPVLKKRQHLNNWEFHILCTVNLLCQRFNRYWTICSVFCSGYCVLYKMMDIEIHTEKKKMFSSIYLYIVYIQH